MLFRKNKKNIHYTYLHSVQKCSLPALNECFSFWSIGECLNLLTVNSLTVQDKQETHEQLSLNKHTAVDHSDNNTVLGTKGV